MRNKRCVDPIWKILLSRKDHILYFNGTRKRNKKEKSWLDINSYKKQVPQDNEMNHIITLKLQNTSILTTQV